MKKKVMIVIVSVLVLALFTSCATQPKATPTTAPVAATEAPKATPAKSFKIGMDVTRLDTDTFAQFAKVFQDYTAANGWTLMSSENQEDSAKMVSNLENMMSAGADAIFSQNIDPAASEDIYKQIVAKGIVLVSYDGESDVANFNWTVDNEKLGETVGQMAGKWAAANFDKPKVIIMRVPFLDFLVTRYEGTVKGVQEACPNCELVATVDVNAQNVADNFESALIAHPDANVFIFPADADAYNGYQILKQVVDSKGLDPKDYGIFATDGSSTVIPLIAEGTMYRGTVDLGLKTEVPTAAMDAIAYVLTNGAMGKQYPKDNYYPCNPITIDNAASYLTK